MANKSTARSARAFGQVAGLNQQVVGCVGVRGDQWITGLEQPPGKFLVDPSEPVFPVAGEQPLGLGASQFFGGGPVAGGKFHARQFVAYLDGPAAIGVDFDCLAQSLVRGVTMAGQPLGDPGEVGEIGLFVGGLGLCCEGRKQTAGIVEAALLHRVDQVRGQNRSRRRNSVLGGCG